ncbi:hypothetical protein JVU11DRAFT_60 [Chiua virens]|nr:hypothetical protein JVU11DRAFT_60 [Chiua virens]
MNHYGYPLLSPKPNLSLDSYQKEGLQVGDVGFVDRDGIFHVRGNIRCESSSKINQFGLLPSNFQPISLDKGLHIITSKEETSLVKSEHIEEDLSGDPRFSKVASQYGHRWCENTGCRSVYLITGLYKTRSWSRAYFTHQPGKVIATPQDGKSPTETYAWTAERGNVYNNGHTEESRINQTVFTRGFRITRKDPAVWKDRSCLSNLWTLVTDCLRYNKLVDVRHEPTFVQPFDIDIPDEINRRLLKKFPSAKVAIVHDDEWTSMLDKGGLAWDDPVQIVHFVENILQSSTVEPDHELKAVFLRNTLSHPLTSDDVSLSTSKRMVIQSFRAENIFSGLRRMPFGFYVQVDGAEWKTETKRSGVDDTTVEWMDVTPLPHSADKVRLSVCVAFGFDQTLGGREVLHTREVEMIDLINSTYYLLEFPLAESESLRPSLFLTLGKRLTNFWSASDHDSNRFSKELTPQFEEETILGHDALVHYYRHYKKGDVVKAVAYFQDALGKVSCRSDCYYATALFNLATAQFNKCMFDGTCANLYTPVIGHFQDVLEVLPDHHPDRLAVLLQLSRALLCRYEKRGDRNSPEADIETLMERVEPLCAKGSHERQAMNLILQTYKRCKLEHGTHNLDDLLLKEFDRACAILSRRVF